MFWVAPIRRGRPQLGGRQNGILLTLMSLYIPLPMKL
jgi:hypothetical protein